MQAPLLLRFILTQILSHRGANQGNRFVERCADSVDDQFPPCLFRASLPVCQASGPHVPHASIPDALGLSAEGRAPLGSLPTLHALLPATLSRDGEWLHHDGFAATHQRAHRQPHPRSVPRQTAAPPAGSLLVSAYTRHLLLMLLPHFSLRQHEAPLQIHTLRLALSFHFQPIGNDGPRLLLLLPRWSHSPSEQSSVAAFVSVVVSRHCGANRSHYRPSESQQVHIGWNPHRLSHHQRLPLCLSLYACNYAPRFAVSGQKHPPALSLLTDVHHSLQAVGTLALIRPIGLAVSRLLPTVLRSRQPHCCLVVRHRWRLPMAIRQTTHSQLIMKEQILNRNCPFVFLTLRDASFSSSCI